MNRRSRAQWCRKKLARSCLYLVLDRQVAAKARLIRVAEKAAGAGVDIIQLRDKVSSTKELCHFFRLLKARLPSSVIFIVNDRVDVALVCDADGVHLGQDDLPLTDARRLMGRQRLIGLSCQTPHHILQAREADYIGLGSVFPTLTKPERRGLSLSFVRRTVSQARQPVFAIGGIDERRLPHLREAGVKRVAVTRAIVNSRNPERTVARLKEILLTEPVDRG